MKKPSQSAFDFERGYDPETPSPTNPIFSASEMEERVKRLKAEGRMPSLAEVLRSVQKAVQK